MSVLFYRRPLADNDDAAAPALPADIRVRVWRPAEHGPPPRGSRLPSNYVWWGFSLFGLFAQQTFAELTFWRDGRAIHRLILTPRWRRFPFMAPADLQVGALWTRPEARGRGVAALALAEAHRQAAGRSRRLWYLVDADNAASIRLAEASGYSLAGEGRRTRPFGLALLGQFRLETRMA